MAELKTRLADGDSVFAVPQIVERVFRDRSCLRSKSFKERKLSQMQRAIQRFTQSLLSHLSVRFPLLPSKTVLRSLGTDCRYLSFKSLVKRPTLARALQSIASEVVVSDVADYYMAKLVEEKKELEEKMRVAEEARAVERASQEDHDEDHVDEAGEGLDDDVWAEMKLLSEEYSNLSLNEHSTIRSSKAATAVTSGSRVEAARLGQLTYEFMSRTSQERAAKEYKSRVFSEARRSIPYVR